MLTLEKQILKNKNLKTVETLPFYIQQYYNDKTSNLDFSEDTMETYLHSITVFFDWLISDAILKVESRKDITLEMLDTLSKDVVQTFFNMYQNENIAPKKMKNKAYKSRKKSTYNTMNSALRSLFNYLATETETETKDTYLTRNVMTKFPLKRVNESITDRSTRINEVILKEDDITGFLSYLRSEYEKEFEENYRKISRFKRDQLRDIAICSLFLGSGIRLNELVSLQIDNLDFKNNAIRITRKGGKEEKVPVVIDAMIDIEKYLKVRDEQYKEQKSSPFVFISNRSPALPRRTVQTLVKKYTGAYLKNGGILPHKLRHSFALDFAEKVGDIQLLSEQLGHNNIDTTKLYVNKSFEARVQAIEKVGEARAPKTPPL